MDKYSVLLVDDEEFVFQVIMKKMDWEGMGFTISGYARNGVEALEKAEELTPDVVMTDVKMPYIDGLTLAKRLKELYPGIKVIIFSGFDEFEYAKEAIKIEAEEYILKPIDAGELKEVFSRIKTNLDKERDEKRNIDKLKEHYLKSLPILQENFWISLIEGRIMGDNLQKYAFDYQIELGTNYIVSVFNINYQSKNGKDMDVAPFLLSVSVQKLLEEELPKQYDTNSFVYLGDVVCISKLGSENDLLAYTDAMDRLCKLCFRICNAKVTCGIGTMCENADALSLSYQNAKNAISYRVMYGSMRAISISEIEKEHVKTVKQSDDAYISDLFKQIKLSDEAALNDSVDQLIAYVDAAGWNLSGYKLLWMKLVVAFYDFLNEYHIDVSAIFEREDIADCLTSQDSTKEIGAALKRYGLLLQKEVESRRTNVSLGFVEKACDYVKENYTNPDINVESVCEYLSLSTSYFSTVFKKSTGKTFINYLTDYRMKKAIELLDTKEKKTYEIAEAVGYVDPNYFSYVFKKQFGVAPSKYDGNVTGIKA